MQTNHYRHFYVMIGLHFVAMYILMYAMVNAFANVFNSVNQVYMAALMTSSMVLIELPLMRSMYQSKKLNMVIILAGILVLVGSWFAIRQQSAVDDRQFLRSMISASRGSDPDVSAGFNRGSGNQRVVQKHYRRSAIRD